MVYPYSGILFNNVKALQNPESNKKGEDQNNYEIGYSKKCIVYNFYQKKTTYFNFLHLFSRGRGTWKSVDNFQGSMFSFH